MKISITDPDALASAKLHAVRFTNEDEYGSAATVIHLTHKELWALHDAVAFRLAEVK